jgi:Flp pilus assembly protein TadG
MDIKQKDCAGLGFVPWRQSGATAIEFALVLPLLIALTYSLLVYPYVYVVRASLNYAAQQGAEAAIAIAPDPDEDEYRAQVTAHVQNVVAGALSWIQQGQRDAAIGAAGSRINVQFCDGDNQSSAYCPPVFTGATAVVVPVEFPLSDMELFPVMTLPGIGTIPPLPDTLTGVGVAMLSGA